MKRREFEVVICSEDGQSVVARAIKYAFNSAVRESEALIRSIARDEGQFYHGGKPSRSARVYLRTWTSDNGQRRLLAQVGEL